jgi:hypothetical protein
MTRPIVTAAEINDNPWAKFRAGIKGEEVREIGKGVIVDSGSMYFVDNKPRTIFRKAHGEDYTPLLSAAVNAGAKTSKVYQIKSDTLPKPHKIDVSVQSMEQKNLAMPSKPPQIGDEVVILAWQTEKGSVLYGLRPATSGV